MAKRSSLYPEILFHFTDKAGLFSILENNFQVSYARETIVGGTHSRAFAVPMVSFCDLRLSELKSHIDKYGRYGIGMSKAWADAKGLNPVLYMNKHCPSTKAFITAVEKLYSHIESLVDIQASNTLSSSYMDILNLYRYFKNYQGDLVRKGRRKIQNYRFADEREWRYVPPVSEVVGSFVPLSGVETTAQKNALNQKLLSRTLTFSPEDISYLIVKDDSERTELITHLEHAKRHYNDETRRRLASRVLSSDQIANDM